MFSIREKVREEQNYPQITQIFMVRWKIHLWEARPRGVVLLTIFKNPLKSPRDAPPTGAIGEAGRDRDLFAVQESPRARGFYSNISRKLLLPAGRTLPRHPAGCPVIRPPLRGHT